LRACCGHGGKYNYNRQLGCGAKRTVGGKEILVGKSCKDPSEWISWDGVHYTQAANKWIFDRIVDGSFSDPPVPLKMACQRQPVHWCVLSQEFAGSFIFNVFFLLNTIQRVKMDGELVFLFRHDWIFKMS